jgi:hypothetical protein
MLPTLRGAVGHGDAGLYAVSDYLKINTAKENKTYCLSVLIDSTAGYHRSNRIIVFDGLIKRFQKYHTTAFASTIACTSLIKGIRPACFSKKS